MVIPLHMSAGVVRVDVDRVPVGTDLLHRGEALGCCGAGLEDVVCWERSAGARGVVWFFVAGDGMGGGRFILLLFNRCEFVHDF